MGGENLSAKCPVEVVIETLSTVELSSTRWGETRMAYRKGTVLKAMGVAVALGIAMSLLSGASAWARSYTFVLSMKGPGGGNPFWAEVERGAREAAQRLGINLTVQSPPQETDVAIQIAQLEDQITRRVDALIVAPTDVSALNATFDRAREVGIPVLLVDTDATWEHKATFIGTDNREGGRLGGEFLCSKLTKGSEVAILTGVMTTQSIRDRVFGARTAMESCGLKVVAELPANSDRLLGQQVMEDILTSRPNVVGVFSANDLMALGALEAIKARGKLGRILVVGFDAIPEAVESILRGEMAATVAQNPYNMGRFGVEYAVRLLQGQVIPKRVDTGTELVTTSNAAKFKR